MKITAGQLRQIIKEELGSLNEQYIPQGAQERLHDAMVSIAEFVMDKYGPSAEDIADGIDETKTILIDMVDGFIDSLNEVPDDKDNDMDTDNDGKISTDELSDEIEDIRDDL